MAAFDRLVLPVVLAMLWTIMGAESILVFMVLVGYTVYAMFQIVLDMYSDS